MLNDRIQKQIDRLFDEAEEATSGLNWSLVKDRAQSVLALDPENEAGRVYGSAAERGLVARQDSNSRWQLTLTEFPSA